MSSAPPCTTVAGMDSFSHSGASCRNSSTWENFSVGGTFEKAGEQDIRKTASDPGMEPPEFFFVGVYCGGQHHQVVKLAGIHDGYLAGDRSAIRAAHYHARLVRPVEAEGFVDDGGLCGNGGYGFALVFKARFVVAGPVNCYKVKMFLKDGVIEQDAAAVPGAGCAMDHQQGWQGIGAGSGAKQRGGIVLYGKEGGLDGLIGVVFFYLLVGHYPTAKTA